MATHPTPATPTNPNPSTTSSARASAPQTGIWFDDFDPQFLIQWSLQEEQNPQQAPADSQAAPATTQTARVRIFQEVFQTTLAAARPVVPFSLRDVLDSYPYLQGSLVLVQQASDSPVLLVKNLRFSGFHQAQVVLYPAAQQAPQEDGGTAGEDVSPGRSGGQAAEE